jgi:large subunit ribosomal protein L6
MENIKKNYTIKIPNSVAILYCSEKNIITVIGALTKKSLKLKVKIEVLNIKKLIKVSSIPLTKISNSKKKSMLSIQGTTTALIKQLILETSYVLYKKLNLVGVGYRAFDVENFEKKLLFFKLGYSHSIYFKIPIESEIFCLKRTKLFVYGNSYQNITQIASFMRSYKKPEPYKGKGILYETEKIILKEGKKV